MQMKNVALYLLILLPLQSGQVQFDNDLVHLSMSLVRAESIEEMSSVSSKIGRLDAANQLKDGNAEDLRIFKKEIDQLMLIDENIKREFVGLNNQFRAAAFTAPNNRQEFSDKYEVLLRLEKKISQIVGKQNAISWTYKLAVLDMEGRLSKSQIAPEEIMQIIDAYEKKYGKKSLFLADLYWNLNRKFLKAEKYKDAIAIYEKAKEKAIKYTSNRSRRFYSIQTWAIKCYMEIGETKKAQDIISSISASELCTVCDGMYYELFIFNSAAATLGAMKNSLDTAIIFQEAALAYLEVDINKEDSVIAVEARKLRDFFNRKGDRASANRIEDKYKIKPLANKPDSK